MRSKLATADLVNAVMNQFPHDLAGETNDSRRSSRSSLLVIWAYVQGYKNARSLQGGYLAYLQTAAMEQQPAAHQQ